ncbi:hypothetical protein [Bradyrhizobium sp. SZCCHNPS1003]|uniref:hypothetical protein n=1 Tax=Bradyrhizobium sp. SZCCHNPS1003 TaxID=3057330 RepID=UPI0028E53B20|nr:hypothetical protein [Bradyrhizobium sp. SZCCHNPS1003]
MPIKSTERKYTAQVFKQKLPRRHSRGCIAIPELRVGCGYAGGAERSIDLWVIEANATKGCTATSYEIKVSRSDFLKDVQQPLKQRGARLFSDQFFFVTPPGLLKPEEIPDWAGLLEPQESHFWGNWPTFKTIVPAPIRSKDAPSWQLVVSLLRRQPIIVPDIPEYETEEASEADVF